MTDIVKGKWSGASAFNLELALAESKAWIEEVVAQKFQFQDDFQASLKDGILLCKLINQIKPGIVPKVNNQNTDFAKRENLSFFIKAAKQLGLRDTQLFESTDLFEAKRIRNVAISLYWLGRAARGIPTYKGPQLNLLAFQKMNCSACKKSINDNNYLATLNQQWHTACAVCSQCHCNLDPKKPFFMEGENIWCQDCMVGVADISGNNNKSKSPSTGNNKGHKHNHDNECVSCHGSLEKGYVPEQDKRYCTNCICDLCHNPLIGNFNIVNGQKICDECSCTSCGTPLKDGFFEEGISRYCEPCNKNRNKGSPSSSPADKGHSHPHSHDHGNNNSGKPASSTTSTSSPKSPTDNSKKCKECATPITNKPVKGNDRDKYCPKHENNCCKKCDKEIQGESYNFADNNYHPNCFNCSECNKPFGPGESIKKSPKGEPVCQGCSNGGGSKKSCHECKKPIAGGRVEALDHDFHPQCFKCRSCDKVLTGDYQEVDNDPYCEPCANQLHKHTGGGGSPSQSSPFITSGWGPNDKCASCVKSLSGQVAKIQDVYYHKGCFNCQDCKTPLITGYYPHDKKPYCKKCHDKIEESNSNKCPKCGKGLVEGQLVKAGNKTWHKSCFSCTTCNKSIGNGDGFIKFSKPYCRDCFNSSNQVCCKCRNQIQGEAIESNDKIYCQKCAPPPTSKVIYGERTPGFTIDPRSGNRKIRD
eukprot:gene5053-6290_t